MNNVHTQTCETSSDSSSKLQANVPILGEIKQLFKIALPTSAVQLLVYLLFTQAASTIGRQLGTVELASFSLASLTGNLLCLSTIIGSLSASDTLMPRAFGLKQYEEVGRLAIRGFIACALILIPITVPLLLFSNSIYVSLGIDPDVSKLASEWLRIYILGIPFVLLFRDIQRFLAAQNIVAPMVTGSFVGTVVVAPFLMKSCVEHFGFAGSALAIVCVQIVSVIVSILYVKIFPVHHPETWPGFSSLWKDSIKLEDLFSYLRLSTGGVVSFTEWWFWESICFTAGRFGVVPFCVHSIAYQILPLCYMIPLGFGIGLSVRMGALFSKSVEEVKLLVKMILVFNLFLAGSVVFLICYFRDFLISLFTSDEEVMIGCRLIWPKMAIYVFLLYFFCINSYITRALGQQWRMAAIVIATLWCTCLPTVLYVCIHRGGGLYALWTILPIAYFVLNMNLIINYVFFTDWNAVAEGIKRKRSSVATNIGSEDVDRIVNENTHLISDINNA